MNKALQIDFNNMLQENVPCGITREEIAAAKARIPEIHRGVEAKRRENTWRDLPFNQDKIVADIQKEAKRINDNYENFVVFGIGGSALGSKALFTALKHIRYNELPREKRGGARFYVLDNIDPDSINGLLDIIDPAKTVFHVITKSGNTVETVTQFMVALDLIKNRIGEHYTDNIILTTDKENGNIKRIADEHGFKAFVVPDGVGGRFSVLCPVGLVSAAVLNIDIAALLKGAGDMDKICSNPNLEENPAYMRDDALCGCASQYGGMVCPALGGIPREKIRPGRQHCPCGTDAGPRRGCDRPALPGAALYRRPGG